LKNKLKHGLDFWRIEEMFFNKPLLIYEDNAQSEQECRCYALGKTDDGQLLFIAFTVRGEKIRVISARTMNKKERNYYEENA
jgi:hypothetical protein